jgi:hypothetical protein
MKFRYLKLPLGGPRPGNPLIARPMIPIRLVGPASGSPSPFYALLDSGADKVLMPADLAAHVGILDITTGALDPIVGVGNQRVDVRLHPLAVEVVGDNRPLALEVGFAPGIVVPLLGRSFFRHYRSIVFSEQNEEVELK